MIDKEMLEQFQMLAGMIQDNREEIKASETRMKVFIENQVSDKIKGLFDGYKSALENQALLELANKTLLKRLDDVESRLEALENKTA